MMEGLAEPASVHDKRYPEHRLDPYIRSNPPHRVSLVSSLALSLSRLQRSSFENQSIYFIYADVFANSILMMILYAFKFKFLKALLQSTS